MMEITLREYTSKKGSRYYCIVLSYGDRTVKKFIENKELKFLFDLPPSVKLTEFIDREINKKE